MFTCTEQGEIEACPGGQFVEDGKCGSKGKERRRWKCKTCADKDHFFTGTMASKLRQHWGKHHSEAATQEYVSCGVEVSTRPALENECALLVSNVAKQHNLGEMIRSAVAFSATTLYTVHPLLLICASKAAPL